jgi:hypothetical protein
MLYPLKQDFFSTLIKNQILFRQDIFYFVVHVHCIFVFQDFLNIFNLTSL